MSTLGTRINNVNKYEALQRSDVRASISLLASVLQMHVYGVTMKNHKIEIMTYVMVQIFILYIGMMIFPTSIPMHNASFLIAKSHGIIASFSYYNEALKLESDDEIRCVNPNGKRVSRLRKD